MGDYIWRGGAAVVTGVSETIFAGANWTGDGALTCTMTAEDGTTQTSVLSTTAVTLEAQRDLFLTQLQGESQNLFAAVTWTSSSTTTILGTAKVPGVPFYSAVADTDTAGGITHNKDGTGNSVLSEGPEDWNTDGSGNYNSTNWIGGDGLDSVKPPNGNHAVRFNQGAWSARYGMNQTTGVNEIRVTEGFTGDIGDPVNGNYLILDMDTGGAGALYINKTQGRVWITCIGENAYITGTAAGADAVKFGAASDLTGIRITGSGVRGTVTCATGMVLDNIVMAECPAAILIAGAVTDLDRVDVGAGRCELTMANQSVAVHVVVFGSGTVIHNSNNSAGTVLLWQCYGGRSEYNGQGNLTNLKVYAGVFTIENSTADVVTIATTNQYGGQVTEGGMQSAIWTNYYKQGGGSDISATINQWGTATD